MKNKKLKIISAAIVFFSVFGVLSIYEGGYNVKESILRSAISTFFYILFMYLIVWKKESNQHKGKEI
jgi:hypothetical protein